MWGWGVWTAARDTPLSTLAFVIPWLDHGIHAFPGPQLHRVRQCVQCHRTGMDPRVRPEDDEDVAGMTLARDYSPPQ